MAIESVTNGEHKEPGIRDLLPGLSYFLSPRSSDELKLIAQAAENAKEATHRGLRAVGLLLARAAGNDAMGDIPASTLISLGELIQLLADMGDRLGYAESNAIYCESAEGREFVAGGAHRKNGELTERAAA